MIAKLIILGIIILVQNIILSEFTMRISIIVHSLQKAKDHLHEITAREFSRPIINSTQERIDEISKDYIKESLKHHITIIIGICTVIIYVYKVF